MRNLIVFIFFPFTFFLLAIECVVRQFSFFLTFNITLMISSVQVPIEFFDVIVSIDTFILTLTEFVITFVCTMYLQKKKETIF